MTRCIVTFYVLISELKPIYLLESNLTDPIILKRIERLEERFKEATTVIISKIGSTEMKTITSSLKLRINVIEWNSQNVMTNSYGVFNWKRNITESMQAEGREGYMKHLSEAIQLPSNME